MFSITIGRDDVDISGRDDVLTFFYKVDQLFPKTPGPRIWKHHRCWYKCCWDQILIWYWRLLRGKLLVFRWNFFVQVNADVDVWLRALSADLIKKNNGIGSGWIWANGQVSRRIVWVTWWLCLYFFELCILYFVRTAQELCIIVFVFWHQIWVSRRIAWVTCTCLSLFSYLSHMVTQLNWFR